MPFYLCFFNFFFQFIPFIQTLILKCIYVLYLDFFYCVICFHLLSMLLCQLTPSRLLSISSSNHSFLIFNAFSALLRSYSFLSFYPFQSPFNAHIVYIPSISAPHLFDLQNYFKTVPKTCPHTGYLPVQTQLKLLQFVELYLVCAVF